MFTIYNILNAAGLENAIDQYEDAIDDEAGYIEFIGLAFNNSMIMPSNNM